MSPIALRPYSPNDQDWLVAQHAHLYARDEGFDDSFGPLVRRILTAFAADHDAACEAGWIAHDQERPLGSIFCVRQDDQTAKPRLFLLVPEARGTGLGHRLLMTCTEFAKSAGYTGMQLWTHESHTAACALYARNGWALAASKQVHSFGVDLVEQHWILRF